VRVADLSVDQRKIHAAQQVGESDQRDLGTAALGAEHRFAAEQLADRDAINAADQSRTFPYLNAVGVAQCVEA
jgi:hypothetical protein